ncbi:MAG: hypothetical protein MRY83_22035 [Flavobacteriales bacterium]|nr:hypothetical protein [Flavobacteriales bacterium]
MKKAIFIIGSILLFATGKAQNWEVFKTSNSGIIGNNVQDIVKIGEYYYIGTTRGLSQFDGSNTWVNYDESNSNLYDDFITCVEKGPNTELYRGHFISGFSVFANGTFPRYN